MTPRIYTAIAAALVLCMVVYAEQAFFSRDRGVQAFSSDPMGDVMEVAVAFGNFYGFEGTTFGLTMGGVFGVECRYLQKRQNCMGGTGTYQGSFQHGVNEQKEGVSIARQMLPRMLATGAITPEQSARFTAALDAAQGSRMHHLANTLSALARHARIAGPLQAQYTQPQDLAAAHEAYQFASSLQYRIINGSKGGLAGPAPNFGNNCDASGPGSVLQAIQRIATGKCARVIAKGIAEAAALTGAPVPPYDPSKNYFADAGNTSIFNQSTNGGIFSQTPTSPFTPFGSQSQGAYTPNPPLAATTAGAASPLASGPREYAPYVAPAGSSVPSYFSATPEVLKEMQQSSDAPHSSEKKLVNATIACVADSGKAKVRWSCPASASVSRGLATPKDSTFTTRGALAGVVTVNPITRTTYTVQCIQNQQILGEESCQLKSTTPPGTTRDRRTVLSISATPESPQILRRGRRATIAWSTIRAGACIISGEGLAAEGDSGEEQTDPLTKAGTYVYTLECETPTGDTETARARVEVH